MRRSSSSSTPSATSRASGGVSRPTRQPETNKHSMQDDDSHVRVAVRCRPISAKEIKDGHQTIVEFEHGRKVIVNNIGESPSDQLGTRSGERNNLAQVYEFDAVFDWNSTQESVYNSVCRPIVDGVLEGYNGTIFAYGQTGTGKTYTMEGKGNRLSSSSSSSRRTSDVPGADQEASSRPAGRLSSATESAASARLTGGAVSAAGPAPAPASNESRGVIPRAFKHIFDHIATRSDVQFLVRASYMEIYQEEIHDLLRKDSRNSKENQQKLKLHERPDTGVYVKDLTSYVCKSIEEIERVMRVGNQNRKVGATDMNEHSSRSHAIFIITIEQQQQQQQQPQTRSAINVKRTSNSSESSLSASATQRGKQAPTSGRQSSNMIRVGRLNLVDLAGSERQRKTNNSGQRHKESIKINLSLSALGNVINSLKKINEQQSNKQQAVAAADSHVPYRDSKLTRLLQDSLGGNSRTLMIANIGPASYNYDETINTLNYASRAKCIQNRPRLNEDPKDALLRQLQSEIQALRAKLAASTLVAANGSAGGGNSAREDGASLERQLQGNVVAQQLIELREKLAGLESKLLNGGGGGDQLNHHLLEGYTRQQANELEENRAKLMDQADRERMIRDELEQREEAELEIKQSYSSVQQEVDSKRALIRQILLKTKGLRDQLDATQNTYRLELDELDQLQYILQKELRLKCLIMDNFIPNHHVNQLLPRILYDEKRNSCSVEPIDLPLDYCNLNSAAPIQYSDIWQPSEDCIRPQSELERVSETINPNDARYKYENVLELRVQPPSFGAEPRLQQSQLRPQETNRMHAPSKIQAMIEAALNEHEPDIVV